MLNTLQAASRLLVRASIALFTVLVLLLIQSAFWSSRVSAWMQLVILATALLSYFRPQYGLLALTVLVPLGQVGSRTLDSQMRGAEALVLAFLAGALVRGWTLRGFRAFPSTRLELAALLFGFVVAASCVEQIWFLQIQRDYPWPFAQVVLTYASRSYIATAQGYGMIFHAMLLLEGLALLLFAVRYAATYDWFAGRGVAVLVGGAVATSALTLWHIGRALLGDGEESGSLWELFSGRRWTVHVSDINAAGSFFAMTAFIALGMAWTTRSRRSVWLTAAAILFAATLLTGSRTAVAAVALVVVAVMGRLALFSSSRAWRAALATAGVAAVAGSVYLMSRTTTTSGATPSLAITIRQLFLQATGNMLAAEPVFGIGVGQYRLWSRYFAPPELLEIYKGDNAHNNFAQIAGELGVAGFAGLSAVLFWSLWAQRQPDRARSLRAPLLMGLAVFILTWLGGHPLLVPEVSFAFWIALGFGASVLTYSSPVNHGSIRAIMLGCILVLAASIPFRVQAKSTRVDFARVSYGLSTRQMMTSRARLFVPADKARIDIPLRSRDGSDDAPVVVDVFVDAEPAENVTITDREWRRARITLSPSSRRFHAIELRIRRSDSADTGSEHVVVEVGKWEII